jgi:hypothetical protein
LSLISSWMATSRPLFCPLECVFSQSEQANHQIPLSQINAYLRPLWRKSSLLARGRLFFISPCDCVLDEAARKTHKDTDNFLCHGSAVSG